MPGQEVTHQRPRIFANGIIAFPKKGWEPPPVPEGYERKAPDLRSPDAWVFIPVLTPCEHRVETMVYTACGACKIAYQCDIFGLIKTVRCQDCEEKD